MVEFYKEVDVEGLIQWGFDFKGIFITNPYISECGRFEVKPSYYGLNEEDLRELDMLQRMLNEERN